MKLNKARHGTLLAAGIFGWWLVLGAGNPRAETEAPKYGGTLRSAPSS